MFLTDPAWSTYHLGWTRLDSVIAIIDNTVVTLGISMDLQQATVVHAHVCLGIGERPLTSNLPGLRVSSCHSPFSDPPDPTPKAPTPWSREGPVDPRQFNRSILLDTAPQAVLPRFFNHTQKGSRVQSI